MTAPDMADSSSDPTRAVDETVLGPNCLGPFTEVRLHAHGGLGEVFRAVDAELNRVVALKTLKKRLANNQEMRRRFLVEAEITARLEHPGIVPVYRMFRDDEASPAYAMRFIEGETLQQAIETYHASTPDPIAFRRLLQSILQVCQTIAYAHSRGVIHRDIKPQNVMLGKFGATLVVDWGLAKVVGRSTEEANCINIEATLVPSGSGSGSDTLLGNAVGTPAYMSPEQAAGRWDVIDHRADVYGVGAVLYSVLTGNKPLKGDNWPELQQKILQGDFAKPRLVKPSVAEPLEAICLKAMALRPEQRYGSVLAIAHDIEHWLADEPVTAYSEPLLTRGRRWIKNHRSLVAAAAGLLLATVFALSIGLLLLERKNREVTNQRTIAENAKQKAEALNRFLTDDLLKQADPANNPVGNKMTVRELLDKAAAGVDSPAGLANVPEVEAEIRTVLGQAYQNLGAADEAVRHYRRAWEIRSSLLGPSHVDALTTRNDYVYTIVDRDLSSDAIDLAKKAFEDCEAALGSNHPESARAQASYGSALMNHGNSAEAEPILRRASEKLRKSLGAEHRATLEADNSLAVALGMSKRAAESERLLANIVQRRRKNPRDSELALALSNHGFTLLILGRYQEAEEVAKEAIEVGRKTVGPQSPGTLQAQNLLAYAFEAQSRWKEAEEQFLTVLQSRRALPPTAFDLQRSLGFTARMYAKQEKWSEAAKYLAELLIAQNPDSNRDPKQLALDLENGLTEKTPSSVAQPLLYECLEGARKPLWSGDWLRGELASRYGECLRKQKKLEEAESILLEADKEITESIAPPKWSQIQSRKRLHDLYLSLERTDEAAKWRSDK